MKPIKNSHGVAYTAVNPLTGPLIWQGRCWLGTACEPREDASLAHACHLLTKLHLESRNAVSGGEDPPSQHNLQLPYLLAWLWALHIIWLAFQEHWKQREEKQTPLPGEPEMSLPSHGLATSHCLPSCWQRKKSAGV